MSFTLFLQRNEGTNPDALSYRLALEVATTTVLLSKQANGPLAGRNDDAHVGVHARYQLRRTLSF